VDYSLEDFEFNYIFAPEITDLEPNFIVKDEATTVTITGVNFFSSPLTYINLIDTEGDRSATVSTVTFSSSTELTFDFPLGVFFDKDFVKVDLTLNGVVFELAEERITIYDRIEVTESKPKYIYTSALATTEVLNIYGAGFWNTESVGTLLCQYDGTTTVEAVYINSTLIVCEVDSQATPGTVSIKVTIDGIHYSANSVEIEFIDSPTLTSLNTSDIFFTEREQSYVLITGVNLDLNRDNDG